ncbi:hypothetical protein ROE7235_03117 [Roseibaca ekhonensis]|uniref:Uncharacterized protein n=1 Tax=Roseinatronobacter ekhonensis TaxID=254356 RepID=A0A3B0MIF4_9RHOB|nr:hypothetical protein ROE7235_03117 [Roseibaca ekhonensis]
MGLLCRWPVVVEDDGGLVLGGTGPPSSDGLVETRKGGARGPATYGGEAHPDGWPPHT